jgi:hypothetical protein
MFENRKLRRIFEPQSDEVTGEWKKLHKKELRDLFSSPIIIRMLNSERAEWAGHVGCGWQIQNKETTTCLLHVMILYESRNT